MDISCSKIVDTAVRTGAKVVGPIPLPTRKERFTVIRGPHIDKLSAQNGTYGLTIPIMDTTARYCSFTDPTAETAVTIECEFDPNLLTMANNDTFAIIYPYDTSLASDPFQIRLKKAGADYILHGYIRADGGAATYLASPVLTDEPHTIRVVWVASSVDGADDGYFSLYMDDILLQTITGIDNDTWDIDSIDFGARTGLDAGTYGIFYMDDCKWNDGAEGQWNSLSSDVLPGMDINYGIGTPSITQRIGQIGRLYFLLDNSPAGKYTPGHADVSSNIGIGRTVRWTAEHDGSTDIWYKFVGKIERIDIAPDEYGAQVTEVTVADWMKDASKMKIASIPAQPDKTIDGVVHGYFSDIETTPNESVLESGANVFTYAGQAGGSETVLLSELRKLANSEPSYIYMRGSRDDEDLEGGVLVVENKTSRDSTDVEATVQAGLVNMKVNRNWDEIKNDIRATVHPSIVDTDTVVVFELDRDIDVPPGGVSYYTGRYTDSDNPTAMVGAYEVGSLSATDYGLWSDSDGFGYASNAVKARYLKYSTDIKFYWPLTDTDAEDEYNSDYDMSRVGTPAITSDGYAGWDYLLLNSTNDNFYADNANVLWDNEKGAMVCWTLLDDYPASNKNAVNKLWRWGSSNTSDSYMMELALRNYADNEKALYTEIQLSKDDYATDPRYKMASSDYCPTSSNDWYMFSVVWDFQYGSTDRADMTLKVYVDDNLAMNFSDETWDTDLTAGFEGTLKPPMQDLEWTVFEGVYNGFWDRWEHNYGVSHMALFTTDLAASDISYLYNNSTDQEASVEVLAGGTSPKIIVTNNQDADVYLKSLILRGKLLTDLTPITVSVSDSDSINSHGVSVYSLDMTYQDDIGVAQTVTSDLLEQLKDPKTQVQSIEFIANYNSDTLDYFLDVEPGDRVAVVEEMSGITATDEFIVNGVQYKVSSPDIVNVKWIVYPV